MQLMNQVDGFLRKRRRGGDAGLEAFLFQFVRRPNLIRRDRWLPGGSQALQHGSVGGADALALIEGPREIDAERNQNFAPADEMDRLGVGEDAVEVEEDGIEHTTSLALWKGGVERRSGEAEVSDANILG